MTTSQRLKQRAIMDCHQRYLEQTKLPPWMISSMRSIDSLVVDLYDAVEEMDPLRLGLPVKWREVKWRR